MKAGITVFLCILVLLILLTGCYSSHNDSAHTSKSTESSIPFLKGKYYTASDIQDALEAYPCIAFPSAVIYYDNALSRNMSLELLPGGRVTIIPRREDESTAFDYFLPDSIYKISLSNNGKQVTGFVSGKYLGLASRLDADRDDQSNLLITHYLSYGHDADDEFKEFPAELIFIKDGLVKEKMLFEAYDAIYISMVRQKYAYHNSSFFFIKYGPEACDYINGEILCYLNENGIDSISHRRVWSNTEGGSYEDYCFSMDKKSNTESIGVREHTGTIDPKTDHIVDLALYTYDGKTCHLVRRNLMDSK